MPITIAELLKHKFVLAAIAAVGVILAGSIAYYVIASAPPALAYVPAVRGSITEDVTGTGTVSPVENPDLSFAVGGRVARVGVQVGDTVKQGQLLASLDTGILSANLAAAQANYAGLVGGPRAVDLAGKQTAVAQAEAAVDNDHASIPAVIANAEAESEEAVRSTDSLFASFSVVDYPHLSFLSEDNAAAEQAGRKRKALEDTFDAWDRDMKTLTASSSPAELDAALSTAIARLSDVRSFYADLSDAANAASPALPSATTAGVASARASVNALILSLQGEQRTMTNDTLAVRSAEDALNLLQAGAAPEAVAASGAQVNAASAALAQAEIIAPYSGTVAAVNVKAGDIASPNAPAIAILPDSNFEVQIYLSEIDAAKLSAGEKADLTLDAFGSAKTFSATVATVDRASTIVNGVPSYKATLVFDEQDPSLASGQGANAVIHVGRKDDALLVPSGAVFTEDNQTYVIKRDAAGSTQVPVVVGLVSTSTSEIISGVSAGDEVARIAGR